jgi:hypothetical protein
MELIPCITRAVRNYGTAQIQANTYLGRLNPEVAASLIDRGIAEKISPEDAAILEGAGKPPDDEVDWSSEPAEPKPKPRGKK